MADSHPGNAAPAPPKRHFSRRSFLRPRPSPVPWRSAPKPSRPARPFFRPARSPLANRQPGRDLQVALVGCGEQGNALAPRYRAHRGPKLVPHLRAIVDIDRPKRAELAGRAKAAGHEAIEYENIDLLSKKRAKTSTPSSWRCPTGFTMS